MELFLWATVDVLPYKTIQSRQISSLEVFQYWSKLNSVTQISSLQFLDCVLPMPILTSVVLAFDTDL